MRDGHRSPDVVLHAQAGIHDHVVSYSGEYKGAMCTDDKIGIGWTKR